MPFKKGKLRMRRHFFTSESVTEGHPDKVCDQISDAILDTIIKDDPTARVACETVASTGLVMVLGEITTSTYVDFQALIRNVLKDIGYTRAKYGFDADTCAVLAAINEQSADIALGVDKSLEAKAGADDKYDLIGAGDQGIVFGYACDQTENYMPLPIDLSHKLAKKLAEVRKDGTLDYLRPDGKTQVTVEYEGSKALRVDTVVVSAQHSPFVSREDLERDIKEKVIWSTIPQDLLDENTKYYINPTGRFEIGGPQSDAGLTGRKIIVDTYGGYSRHGGGAFSGKDPTKVDRSAAYAARHAAKNCVAAGLARELEIEISYAIGVSQPLSIYVNSFGTGKLPDEKIEEIIRENFDFRPGAIIDNLDLRRPVYQKTAAYGHFGRDDEDFTWERLDKVEALKKYL